MVKQRNLYEPGRIDILTDEYQVPEASTAKDLIRLHNEGIKVFGVCRSRRKGASELPLFSTGDNQAKLF